MYDVMASLHILINFFIIASGVPDAGGTPHVGAKILSSKKNRNAYRADLSAKVCISIL